MNKLYYFSDYYPPESNAPALRVDFNSHYFCQNGIDVTIVTCNPNFPDGKLYEGFKNRVIHKTIDRQVNVVRLWSFIWPNSGKFFRILDHVSSAVMFFIYGLNIKKDSTVIATSPQFLTIFSIYLLSYFRKFEFYVEIRDMWPEGIIFLNPNSKLYKVLEYIEGKIYKRSDRIIVVTESFKSSIALRHGIKEEKFIVSFNGCDVEKFKPVKHSNLDMHRGANLILGYAGTIGISHGIDNVCSHIKKYNKTNRDFIQLFIVGSGAYFSKYKNDFESQEIIFMDRIPQELVNEFYSKIDFALVSLLNIKPYDNVIPSKLFESLAYKTPILGALRGEARSIITENKVGEVFENDCYKSFCAAVELLKENNKNYQVNIQAARIKYSRASSAQLILESFS